MAVPGVGSGFGDLYISSNTIHGYVKLIDGATSYKVFYRPSSESSAKSVTADSKGYFFITGLKDNTEYTLNYHGINSSGGGSNMATGHTVNVKNGRNAWTLFSDSAQWGNFQSGATKSISYLTDDCYLYCYSMTFSVSGTVTFKIDANFAVASYLSTSISNSGGKPTGDIVAEVENSGSSYTLSASVSAGTTYYFFFRGNDGRQFIGKVGINLTAPVLATYYVKVSYNANGGSGAPSAQTGNDTDNQVPITISSTKPTRSDYVFLGWAVSSSASSAKYSSGKTYDFQSTSKNSSSPTLITLYAVWYSLKDMGYAKIYTSSGWKKAIPHIYTSSGWEKAIPYIYTSSGWKSTGG